MKKPTKSGPAETLAEKMSLLSKAKERPCADCGEARHGYAMRLYFIPGEIKLKLAVAEKTCEEVADLLAKCSAVCINCMEMRESSSCWLRACDKHDMWCYHDEFGIPIDECKKCVEDSQI